MRDLLVPIFGQWAVVAQFLLTIVIVLGLIFAVWWFMRRYSGVHFGGIGRGRVPRLAILDVMPVDRRRRLVLIRRDNVEHLLLLGGPSDLVVEGAIQRVRQRSAQQAAQVAAARAAMQSALEAPTAEPEASETPDAEQRPANEPIPFPVARNARSQAETGNGRTPLRPVRQPPAAAPSEPATPEATPAATPTATFVEPQYPTQVQPMPAAARPQRPAPQEPAREALLPEVMTAEAEPLPSSPPPQAAPGPATFAEAEWEAAEEARQSALDLGEVDVPTAAAGEEEMVPAETAGEEQTAPATAPGEGEPTPADSAAKVSDLEREMARLLGEITTRRTS